MRRRKRVVVIMSCDLLSSGATTTIMAPIRVLDDYYLAITCLTTFAFQACFFVIAASFKFDLVTDLAYGSNFVFLAILTLLLHRTFTSRQIAVATLVSIWGVRLAAYLFTRILLLGKDSRFDGKRENFFKFAAFWVLQFLAVWLIFLPECLLASSDRDPAHRWNDYLGYVLYGIGLLLESVADLEKFVFKMKGKGKWCCTGLWSWSRHPNYAGELLVWWGLFAVCASSFGGTWRWVALVGPLFITFLLLFLSGVPILEHSADQRYWSDPDYQTYKSSTSLLLPLPPCIYRPLPRILKSTLLLDFPLYYNDPGKRSSSK